MKKDDPRASFVVEADGGLSLRAAGAGTKP
jgi:hypothetical protein